MLNIIFFGDRHWNRRGPILDIMQSMKTILGTFCVVEGEAPGADSIARSCAELHLDLPFKAFPANWNLYGKAAGPIRNTQMRVEGKADGGVAFHDDLAHSKGTKNMLEQLLKAGLPVYVYRYDAVAEFTAFCDTLKEVQRKREFFDKLNLPTCPPRTKNGE